MYNVVNDIIEKVKNKMAYSCGLFYGISGHASSTWKQMPFNFTNVVAVYVRLEYLCTFTCALPNGIAIRGHVRGRNERDGRRKSGGGAACKSGSPGV